MNEQNLEGQIILPLEWHIPDGILSRYVTNIVVQHTEHEFIISFFEVRPPIVLGSDEEKEAQLKQIDSVRAECVARIVVAADRLPDFIRVLNENLATYRSRFDENRE